ncbi:MAG: flagellar basal body P-ring formation chaperone FlgA [Alphaproteobacteria bacterium]|jgi:flagella basal body P-ring formation protein FlgA|nr:flagellar basal body P-ring formation chaperone FlgA [Alphaproteobacteria bacterium]MDP7223043.1 flagellar basal body P-ring formation chaperone FlgA [Alphaproteobacteria bacterium]
MDITVLNLKIAFRFVVLILIVTIGTFFLFAGTQSALAATLKSSSLVKSNELTVGDLFDGVPKEKAEYVLGPSPYPGRDMTLNARTLLRVAMTMDLPWRPSSSADQIVVRRAATKIDSQMITDKLITELMDEGIEDEFDITFHSENPEMILPSDLPASFDLSDFRYDRTRGIFETTLRAPSNDRALTELFVSGTVHRVIKVPVLKETARQNKIIRSNDIFWVKMHDENVQHDILLKEEDLVGMTPRRMISAGKPIRANELTQPQIVKRGENVTIMYQYGSITLTAEGKALENGARDDLIRVVNTSSSRPIDVFVSGEGLVTVSN